MAAATREGFAGLTVMGAYPFTGEEVRGLVTKLAQGAINAASRDAARRPTRYQTGHHAPACFSNSSATMRS